MVTTAPNSETTRSHTHLAPENYLVLRLTLTGFQLLSGLVRSAGTARTVGLGTSLPQCWLVLER
ncbi:hypothetical protein N7534_005978 [Penicillium rubens]|nr:hypothetical protein N7534_005978 [Penicillium rubens]